MCYGQNHVAWSLSSKGLAEVSVVLGFFFPGVGMFVLLIKHVVLLLGIVVAIVSTLALI